MPGAAQANELTVRAEQDKAMTGQSCFDFSGAQSGQSDGAPDYALESKFSDSGAVIGVDEAGRGPWAGPVTAAAFWINPAAQHNLPEGLTDSKQLSVESRERIKQGLCAPEAGHIWAVRHSSVEQIDTDGILPATFAAMEQAVIAVGAALQEVHDLKMSMVLVDGNLVPPFDYPCKAIVRGDSRSLSIAAASILAKQERDAVMAGLAGEYPDYGWQTNAGYGTKAHQKALKAHGVTPHHRKSYAPIRKLIS